MPFQFNIDYKNISDEQLVFYVTKGREKAFNEIYRRFSGPLFMFFYQRLWQNRDRAEDFVQDLFLKVIEKAEFFDRDRNFKTWIYTIAYNMCKNEYRRNKVREIDIRLSEKGLQELKSADLAPIDKSLDLALFSQRLRLELDRLDQKYSLTFILRHEHNLSIKAIAEIMNCPPGTVKSRLFSGTKQLSNRLNMFRPTKLYK